MKKILQNCKNNHLLWHQAWIKT